MPLLSESEQVAIGTVAQVVRVSQAAVDIEAVCPVFQPEPESWTTVRLFLGKLRVRVELIATAKQLSEGA